MRLIILGAGGYGRTVADIARQSGRYATIAFLDDKSEADDVVGKCGFFAAFIDDNTEIYPGFGDNKSRLNWVKRLLKQGAAVPTIIHPSAYVSPSVELSAGTVVLPKAIVNTGVKIGCGCIINCGAIVDHGCVLEDGVHICLGAIVKAENRVPSLMKIEAGEVVENRHWPV